MDVKENRILQRHFSYDETSKEKSIIIFLFTLEMRRRKQRLSDLNDHIIKNKVRIIFIHILHQTILAPPVAFIPHYYAALLESVFLPLLRLFPSSLSFLCTHIHSIGNYNERKFTSINT